jgi:hypothetical protein
MNLDGGGEHCVYTTLVCGRRKKDGKESEGLKANTRKDLQNMERMTESRVSVMIESTRCSISIA